ncbi:MAG: DUF2378 family protein [Polyangiaceae bacterium]|nr:DUF2378 family protein [Polyangiaceae bacterium]
MSTNPGLWKEAPWSSPLDGDALVRAVPEDATMTGMFLDAVAKMARDKGVKLVSTRDRYVAFQPYPLREHCAVLVEVARTAMPELSLRAALRKIGRGAPHVLMQSTVGRVVLGSAEGPIDMLRAMATSYSMHMRPSSLVVERADERSAVVRLSDIHNFLDSHNVGVFEGVLRHAGVHGNLLIRSYSRTAADFLCTW